MKERIMSCILVIITAFSLSACGDKSEITQEQYDALQKEIQEMKEQNQALQDQLEEKEESLSVDEEYIVDFVLEYTADFFNPSEVRVLQCGTELYRPGAKELPYRFARLKIQGTNRLGGTLTQGYRITLDEESYYDYCENGEYPYTPTSPIFLIWKEGDEHYNALFDKSSEGNLTDWWDDESIGRINRALAQHWEGLGIG